MITTCEKHGCEYVKEYCPECVNQKPASDWVEFKDAYNHDLTFGIDKHIFFLSDYAAYEDGLRLNFRLRNMPSVKVEVDTRESLAEVMEKIK